MWIGTNKSESGCRYTYWLHRCRCHSLPFGYRADRHGISQPDGLVIVWYANVWRFDGWFVPHNRNSNYHLGNSHYSNNYHISPTHSSPKIAVKKNSFIIFGIADSFTCNCCESISAVLVYTVQTTIEMDRVANVIEGC